MAKSILENKFNRIVIDSKGGAISGVFCKSKGMSNINPFSFELRDEEMPINHRRGFPFKGHFICLGRWGPPSINEINLGIPFHGQFLNLDWDIVDLKRDEFLKLKVVSPLECLSLEREVIISEDNCIIGVSDSVENVSSLGKIFNMVQHPTIGYPFLDKDLVVSSNCGRGFNQRIGDVFKIKEESWPIVSLEDGVKLDLRSPMVEYNSVFTFKIKEAETYGNIIAFNKRLKLLLGYLWKREYYPWIHFWQDWKHHSLRFRGLEFGTAGIHRPPKSIFKIGSKVFGENVISFIDAQETIIKKFIFFFIKVDEEVNNPEEISLSVLKIRREILVKVGKRRITLPVSDRLSDFI